MCLSLIMLSVRFTELLISKRKRIQMKLCECPFCSNSVTSFWNLGNGAFLLNKNKRCSNCSTKIKLNLSALFFILLLAGFNVIFFFLLGHLIFPEYNNIGFYLITFCILYICFYFQICFVSKYFGLRLFIPIKN